MSWDKNAGWSHNIKIDNSSFEMAGVQIFGNNRNKSKFYSGRNEEQIKFSECLLSFSAESLVFQFATQKHKVQDIQNYNFTCCIVRVWNLIANIAGGM